MKDHKNVALNILEILRALPKAGDSYNQLCRCYWQIYDNLDYLSDIDNATPVETITRNYRKLVTKGLIKLPESRRPKEEVKREYYSEFNSLV